MRKVIIFMNLTLDGVMQSPAEPDEDRSGNFEHGGWGAPYNAMSEAGEFTPKFGALLLGRRTYERFSSVWPQRKDSPFSALLDNMQKYVASTTLTAPLAWMNTTLLEGDAAESVAGLKEQPGGDIVIMGSGDLSRSLMRANLIDEYVLLIHPVALGSGRRLFAEGEPFTLQLVGSKSTSSGVVVAAYRPQASATVE